VKRSPRPGATLQADDAVLVVELPAFRPVASRPGGIHVLRLNLARTREIESLAVRDPERGK